MEKPVTSLFIGRSTLDLTYHLEKYPLEDTKVFSTSFLVQPGGPALNASITYSLLGGHSHLISCFGNGELSDSLKRTVTRRYSITVCDVAKDDYHDFPISSILINPGKSTRTIINSSGNLAMHDISDLSVEIKDCGAVLLDGFIMNDQIMNLMADLKGKGAKIVVDGGSWKEGMERYLLLVDIMIGSNKYFWPGCSREETIQRLHELGVEHVAFTDNEKPIVYSQNNIRKDMEVPAVHAIDTLGAGDVLHGAFCFYLCNGASVEEALLKSAEIASNSCQYLGAHTWAAPNGSEISF